MLTLSALLTFLQPRRAAAQAAPPLKSEDTLPRKTPARQPFRIETLPVGRDAELLTVFGSLDGLKPEGAKDNGVPLVRVLRDTLGDRDAENDRLRYVWMLTYTRPGALQRVASAVPFLYGRVGDKKRASAGDMPPPVIDLADPGRDLWQRVFWLALQNVAFNPYGVFANDHWNFDVRCFNPGGNHGSFLRVSTYSTLLFAGGERTGIPRGLDVTEPYDSLSFAPTLLAITGRIEDGTKPTPALWRQGFRAFPGRVIGELFNQAAPEAPLADTTTRPEEKH